MSEEKNIVVVDPAAKVDVEIKEEETSVHDKGCGNVMQNENATAKIEQKLETDDVVVEAQQYAKSVIMDPKTSRFALIAASMGVFCGSAAYIVMVFIALPLSIHSIVNGDTGCDLSEDDACFAPTDESQRVLTLALTLLRIMTFLMGSFIGLLSDKYGRKPLMLFALAGYGAAGLFFLVGWQARATLPIIIGAAVLGSASPITPHGIAYTTDISKPEELAKNLGILQGLGYFTGLMSGAAISLVIASLTTGREETLENYDALFTTSFLLGSALAFAAFLGVLFFMPESLHVDDRKNNMSIRNANPFGFTALVFRRKYFFFVWLAGMFAWGSVGASESASGGWWLIRYAISETQVFIVFTLCLWVSSALGAVFMTRVYLGFTGLKFSVHISSIFSIILGLVFAFAPNVTTAYLSIGVAFFASPAVPTLLAVIMGQVDSTENGALAGAVRSSEALGKLIGIVTIGNAFARYIAPYRPDFSCMDTWDPVTGANDCDCGINSCPVFNEETAELDYIPAMCDLGQMSFSTLGSPSKNNPPLPEGSPYAILPQTALETGDFQRPGDCLARGLIDSTDGLTSTQERIWCYSAATVTPEVNAVFGCPGYDSELFGQALAFHACYDGVNLPANSTSVDLRDLGLGTANAECTGLNAGIFAELQRDFGLGGEREGEQFILDLDYESVEDLELYAPIHGRVFDPDYEDVGKEFCNDEFGTMELNVCLDGALTDTPWLFPFVFLALLAVFSYLSYCIAEFYCIEGDLREWSSDKRVADQLNKDEREAKSI